MTKHEVYIVTARPHYARGATEFWLGELFGEYTGSIHVKGPKGPLAAALGADLLIDDKEEHVESARAHGVTAHLIARPWNNGDANLITVVKELLQ